MGENQATIFDTEICDAIEDKGHMYEIRCERPHRGVHDNLGLFSNKYKDIENKKTVWMLMLWFGLLHSLRVNSRIWGRSLIKVWFKSGSK